MYGTSTVPKKKDIYFITDDSDKAHDMGATFSPRVPKYT